jgi:hypothetical protein
VTLFAFNAVEQAPVAPVARPTPVSRDEYKAATCPLCFGPLQQRVHGLWCPRDRGWLVESLKDGERVYSLWQGRP